MFGIFPKSPFCSKKALNVTIETNHGKSYFNVNNQWNNFVILCSEKSMAIKTRFNLEYFD